MGDVTLGEDASVWYGAVLRGDMAPIVIGAQTNIQDGTIVHVDDGVPCTSGARVGVGHRVILHGCTVEDECLIGMGSVLLNGVADRDRQRGRRRGGGAGGDAGAAGLAGHGRARPHRPRRSTRRWPARIAETWAHYVEQARAHRAGRFPLADRQRRRQ